MARISWVLVFALACRKEPTGEETDTIDTSDTSDTADTDTGVVDADGDGFAVDVDCDDANPAVNPGALELCDELDVDENCDTFADDADSTATGKTKGGFDGDGDGYAGAAGTALMCDHPPQGDCDDSNVAISPEGAEVCDGLDLDEDCDGLIDDDDPTATGKTKGSYDGDGDGYAGNAGTGLMCDHPTLSNDCDDTQAAVYPGAVEICDGARDNCDDAAWVNDDGRVTENATVDLSASWAAGTTVTPTVYVAPDAATVAICAGSWHVRLQAGGAATFQGHDAAIIAPGAGSALELTAGTADVDVRNLVFHNGTATTVTDVRYGGNVYAPQGVLRLRDSVLEGGSARFGGNLYVGASAEALIENSVIDGGVGNSQGGGIYAEGPITVKDTTMDLNMATFGGAIYLESAQAEIDGLTVTNSVAADTGGGLYAHQSTVALQSSEFRTNDAARGGGLRLDASTVTGSDVHIQQNTIANTGQGGGVSMAGSTLTLAASVISANAVEDVRTEAGAAMALDGDIVCTITGCVVN